MDINEKIQNAVSAILKRIQADHTVWIAYSGGVDSHVLLHAVSCVREAFPFLKFCAVYVNHGLQAEADQWEAHTKSVCHQLRIEYRALKIHVKKMRKHSVEALARKARYGALSELLKEEDVLLTAHHENDQAETTLLQLLRGAGPRGLAAMPQVASFSEGYLMRPFLSLSRSMLVEYANAHQLEWIEDKSNREEKLTRNFLRFRVMPLLSKRWPTAASIIARVAAHCAEANVLLNEVAEEDLEKVRSANVNCLSVSRLKLLSTIRQKNAVRVWLHQQGFLLPSTIKLQHILHDVLFSSHDADPCITWDDVEMHRYADDLYAFKKLPPHDPTMILEWDGKHDLILPNHLGVLHPEQLKGLNLDGQKLTVRFRQGGERCRLPGRQGTHSLKHLLQEWKIPPWQRNRIPLIYLNDTLTIIAPSDRDEGSRPAA